MFLNITQRVAISTAFIPVKMHSFVKEIPFQVIAENIQQLKFQLRHLNPSDATVRKSYIEGRANSYIITSYPHFVSQNTLVCAENGGTIASMAQIISDRLELTESVTASDEMSIVNGEILCTYISTPNRNIHCISQLRNLASILGLRFMSGPDHKIFQDLVNAYKNDILYVTMDRNKLELTAEPRTIVFCSLPKKESGSTPDNLTATFQKKFFVHMNQIFESMLDAYAKVLLSQQHLYTLLINTRAPSQISQKPFPDLCKAVKRFIPTPIPSQLATQTTISAVFLESQKENSLKTTEIYVSLQSTISTLCASADNEPLLKQYFMALQLLNLNIQALLQAFQSQSGTQTRTLNLPSPLPILVTQTTKVPDIQQLFYNMLQVQLSATDLSYTFTLIENEKIYTVLWLKNLLPASTVFPEIISQTYLAEKPRKNSASKIYEPHPELEKRKTDAAKQQLKNQYTPSITDASNRYVYNVQNDQPQQPLQRTATDLPEANSQVTNETPQLHPWIQISPNTHIPATEGNTQLHPWTRMMNQLNSEPPAPRSTERPFRVTQIFPSDDSIAQPQQLSAPATQTQPLTPSIPTTPTQPLTPPITDTPTQSLTLPISAAPTQEPNVPEFLQLQLLPSSSQTLQRRKRNWLSDAFSDLTGLATKESVDIIEANENNIRDAEERTQKELVVVLTKTNEIVKNMDEQASKLSKLYEDEQDVKLALKNVLRDEQDALLQLSQLSTAIEINTDVSTEFMAFGSTLNLIPHMLNEVAESLLSITSQSIYPSLLPPTSIKQRIPLYTKQSILSATISATISNMQLLVEINIPEFMPPFTVYHIKTLPMAHNTTNKLYATLTLQNSYVAINALGETFSYNREDCHTKNGIITCMPNVVNIHRTPTECAEVLANTASDSISLCISEIKLQKIATQSYIYIKDDIIRVFSPFTDTVATLCGNQYNPTAGNLIVGYTDLTFKSNCVVHTSQLTIYSPASVTTEDTVPLTLATPNAADMLGSLLQDIEFTHGVNLSTLGNDFAEFKMDLSKEIIDIATAQQTLKKASTIQDLTTFDPVQIDFKKLYKPTEAMKAVTWTVTLLTFAFLICLFYTCCPVAFKELFKCIFSAIWFLLRCACVNTGSIVENLSNRFRRRAQTQESQASEHSHNIFAMEPNSAQPAATIRYLPSQTPQPVIRRQLRFETDDEDYDAQFDNLRSELQNSNSRRMSQAFDNEAHMRRRQSILLQDRNFDPSSPEDDQYNNQATLQLHPDSKYFTPNRTLQSPDLKSESTFLTPNQTFASQIRPITAQNNTETPFTIPNQTLSTSTPHINDVNYPSLHQELINTKSPLNIQGMNNQPWEISENRNKITLSTRINGVKYNYLPRTKKIHDIHGAIIKTTLPSDALIEKFLKKYVKVPNISIEDVREEKHDNRLEFDISLNEVYYLVLPTDRRVYLYGYRILFFLE